MNLFLIQIKIKEIIVIKKTFFEGFSFRVRDVDIEKKVNGSTQNFTKLQLLNITNFFQIDPKDDEIQITKDVISALCNLETFKNTIVTTSDLEEMQKNMENISCSIKRVNGNSEKDAEQDGKLIKI